MYGIFMECFVLLRRYFGSDADGELMAYLRMAIFIISAIYIIAKEKDAVKKILFGIMPLVILAGFLLPITRKVYVAYVDKEDSVTYYRILWLIPIYIVIAYAACMLLMRLKSDAVRRAVTVAIVLVIMLTGKCVYVNAEMHRIKVENPYHIPQDVIDICDMITPAVGEENPWAVFPEELAWFVRQYDAHILMPYGADYIEQNYPNQVHKVLKEVEIVDGVEIVDAEELMKAVRDDGDRFDGRRYVIMPEDTEKRKLSKDLTTFGLELVDKVGHYNVYKDPIIVGDSDE